MAHTLCGLEAAEALSALLRSLRPDGGGPPTLTALDVHHNEIRPAGAAALASAAMAGRVLKEITVARPFRKPARIPLYDPAPPDVLDLASTGLGHEGGILLARSLAAPAVTALMVELRLPDCGLTDHALDALAPVLYGCIRLRDLVLSANKFGGKVSRRSRVHE